MKTIGLGSGRGGAGKPSAVVAGAAGTADSAVRESTVDLGGARGGLGKLPSVHGASDTRTAAPWQVGGPCSQASHSRFSSTWKSGSTAMSWPQTTRRGKRLLTRKQLPNLRIMPARDTWFTWPGAFQQTARLSGHAERKSSIKFLRTANDELGYPKDT